MFRKRRTFNKEEKSYTFASYINQLGASFLGTDIDRYILALFSTNIQVAIYAVATNILKKLIFFLPHTLFKDVLEPSIYRRYDEKQSQTELNDIFQIIINLNNYVIFLILAIFIPLGRELLSFVFDKEYIQDAYFPLLIFLCFLVIYVFPIGLITKSIKKPEYLIYSKITVILNIALGIPMAMKYGALGIAIATALSTIEKNIIIFILTRRIVKLDIPFYSYLKLSASVLGIILILNTMNYYINIHVLVKLLFIISLYVVVNKFISIYSKKHKNILLRFFPKKMYGFVTWIF
ncbi:MAG: hypothetical protein GF353_24205 [Candidatus Lokiarchaeota archaeon]|nr:hypothetical protein [Candidatus Lokiarchaeota archaeon]